MGIEGIGLFIYETEGRVLGYTVYVFLMSVGSVVMSLSSDACHLYYLLFLVKMLKNLTDLSTEPVSDLVHLPDGFFHFFTDSSSNFHYLFSVAVCFLPLISSSSILRRMSPIAYAYPASCSLLCLLCCNPQKAAFACALALNCNLHVCPCCQPVFSC